MRESAVESERTLLRDQAARVFRAHAARHANPAEVVATWQEAWSALDEIGLSALGREMGDVTDLCAVMEESGRGGAAVPVLESFLVNRLLRDAPGAGDRLAASSSAGFALAFGSLDGDRQSGQATVTGGHAHGALGQVAFADALPRLALLLDGPPRLALVALRGPGVRIQAQAGLERPAVSRVVLDGAPAEIFDLAARDLESAHAIARTALCARALGAASRAFDLALEHAKTRQQFGQPIGRFQAIQHKLADARTRLDGVRLALDTAARALDEDAPDRAFFTAALAAAAGPALRQTMLDAQHVFAAIGFSEEHESPHHFRRVHADVLRLGGVTLAREALAAQVLHTRTLPVHDLGPEAAALRADVRALLATHWTPADRERADRQSGGPHGWDRGFSKVLAERGWIGLSWPKAIGGQGRSVLEHFALLHELDLAGAPTSMHTAAEMTVGPAILAYGTPAQRDRYLPATLRGELTVCLGYSEPEAGSDLASLRTRAVRDGDEWVIHGQKLWTTGLEHSQYIWLAARTDPDARAPHLGISMFMVPLDTPGITRRPSLAFYGAPFTATFWDGVRVPHDALVGEVNGGWKLVTHALAGERLLMGSHIAKLESLFGELCTEVAADPALATRADVRARIGELAADVEIARQLVFRTARLMDQGGAPMAEAAMCKVVSGELMERLSEAALDLLGVSAMLEPGAPGAACRGRIQQMLRTSIMMVVGGGTAEIQRNLIAQRGLGLPR